MFDAEIEEKSRDLIVLERARELLRQRGCWHGESPHKEGVVCAALAINHAALDCGVEVTDRTAPTLLGGFDTFTEVAIWNDAATDAEVLARFDSAIARLSAQPAGRG
jgi:hypothetical protein